MKYSILDLKNVHNVENKTVDVFFQDKFVMTIDQVGTSLPSLVCHPDHTINEYLETLKKTVANLEATFIPKPMSPLVLPESGLDLVFDTPRSMKDYHFQQVNFSPAFPATPELFKEFKSDLLNFPPE